MNNTKMGIGIAATAAVFSTLMFTPTDAHAASYKCKTSKKSVDDPSYSGPWADNWDFTVAVCVKRSGGYIHAYSKASWDGPVGAFDADWFRAAGLRVYVKKSVSGPDPIKKYKTYLALKDHLHDSDSWGNYNGSYTSGVVKFKAGSGKYIADAAIKLDWTDDGKGIYTYKFSASPRV